MKRLGVGFVGAGYVVTNCHLNAWKGIRDADVNGICDLDSNRAMKAKKICTELGIGNPKLYTDVADLVNDPEVNAVWITVPNFARLSVMKTIVEEVSQGKAELIGIVCEKPLARNVKEARKMLELVGKTDLLHGYLENQVFSPSITVGKELVWRRGARICGRPYLARSSEEHSGPHEAWFWDGTRQGGGALNDLMCHSLEATRFLLTDPDENKNSLVPRTVSADIASLKWTRPRYAKKLKEMTKIDYSKNPVEDFATGNIMYETPDGDVVASEVSASWSFVGPGMRVGFELMGPEYYMQINSLNTGLNVFFSRAVTGEVGEDMVEKQSAEQGLMPVVPDHASSNGYRDEDTHMVKSFLEGKMPFETWEDGAFIVELLMTCYMAAEKGKKLKFPPHGLEDFVPKVAQGIWEPKCTVAHARN